MVLLSKLSSSTDTVERGPEGKAMSMNPIINALSEAAITDAAWGFEFKHNKTMHDGNQMHSHINILGSDSYRLARLQNHRRTRDLPGESLNRFDGLYHGFQLTVLVASLGREEVKGFVFSI